METHIRRWRSLLAAAALASLAIVASAAPERVALVIGNAGYPAAPLANPRNDARAMGALLQRAGFQVDQRIDTSQEELGRAIEEFGRLIRDPSVRFGLFYYAGHGLQLDWRNYLVPVSANIRTAEDVRKQTVDVSELFRYMNEAKGRSFLIILDACRDDPFAGAYRPPAKGLSQFDAPVGSLLAYATSPGNVALDGEGANGLYTSNLLNELQVRGAKVEDVFKRVRLNVRLQSRGRQVPWETTSLEEDVYLFPVAKKKLSEAEQEAMLEQEIAAWSHVKSSSNIDALANFLREHPSGYASELAQSRLNRLLAAQAQYLAQQQDDERQRAQAVEQAKAAREAAERESARIAEAARRERAEDTARIAEAAKRAKEDEARRVAEESARREAEAQSQRRLEEARRAEEAARVAQQQQALQQAELARQEQERQAARLAAAERRAREDEAARQADLARRAQEEEAARVARERARLQAEQTARLQLEEATRAEARIAAERQAQEKARREAQAAAATAPPAAAPVVLAALDPVALPPTPYSTGYAEHLRNYKTGDLFVFQVVDRFTNAASPLRLKVSAVDVDNDRVEFNGGEYVSDLMGNIVTNTRGSMSTPRQFYPAEIFVGKKWQTMFHQQRPNGVSYTFKYDVRVAAREKITVPAGTFDAYRIEAHGFNMQLNAAITRTIWIVPGIAADIAHETTVKLRNNQIEQYDRQELVAIEHAR